jgi:hypothetical protein
MSGELIATVGGKVPQRAIRYLDQLPYVATYQLDEDNIIVGVDFGGADEAFIINTHNSKRAKCVEALVYDITENFAGTTTKASIEVGDGSDADGFCYTDDFVDAEMTTAVGAKHYSSAAGSITAGALGEIIEADDQVTITCVASTGSPTGIGRVAVSFLYFD